ncbi:MAG: lysozyme inhibitor LprI family protein [Acidimicrobiales bacterium]
MPLRPRSPFATAARRRLLPFGVLAVFALALASCGSSSPTSTTTTSAATPVITEHFTRLPCNHTNTLGLEGCAEGQLLSADRRIDAEVKLLFSLIPTAQRTSLRSAEKVFLTYRKSTCLAYSDVYRGGTFAPVEYALCEVRLDEVQSTTLHVYFRLADEGASRSLTWP